MTEYLAGGDLFDRILSRGAYPESEARCVVRQLLTVLAHLHGPCGIAHRDLKPENVLLEVAPLQTLSPSPIGFIGTRRRVPPFLDSTPLILPLEWRRLVHVRIVVKAFHYVIVFFKEGGGFLVSIFRPTIC